MTTFTRGTTTITITSRQNVPFTVESRLAQVSGLDSSGAIFVYDRGPSNRTLSIVWPRLTAVELSALTNFLSITVQGGRHPFIWFDDSGVVRPIRYNAVTWQQRSADQYQVTLTVIEEQSTPLPQITASLNIWDGGI